ncbi:hypothetical protein K2P56_04940 [Patescibacteria group bacterium]|nr:hypothetical protein [Patescibacteria group bacterium]
MDELDVKGIKYISSKRGAELTGYAKDYIGQLARAGKVPGTRLGRAWFVEEAALLKHLGTDATSDVGAEIVSVQKSKEETTPSTAVTSTTQAKKPLLSHHMITPAVLPKTWSSVQYLTDDSDLFPAIVPRVTDVPVAPKPLAEEKKNTSEVSIPIPVHVPASVISVQKRVATLVDGIRPRSAVLRVAPKTLPTSLPVARFVPEKVQKPKEYTAPLQKSLTVRWSPGSFANMAAVFVFVFGFLASFSFMKNSSFGGSEALTASTIYGLTDFFDVLKDARIFDAGMEAITGFYILLSQSFIAYLNAGISFVIELF